jgi:hypothetical protein
MTLERTGGRSPNAGLRAARNVNPKEVVLAAHRDAYAATWAGSTYIRRPRGADDKPSILAFVSLSGGHRAEEQAWEEAARRLRPGRRR